MMKTFLALLIASGAMATDTGITQVGGLANEEVVYRAVVPSADDPHGEVRLIRRGKATVLQTVLHTKLLRRAVGIIREREAASWVEGSVGHDDSMAYSAALDHAQKKVWWRYKQRGIRDDRRQSLLIEFVVSASEAYVTIDEPQVDEESGVLSIGKRIPLARLDVSREYAKRNIWLIANDSFGVTLADLAQMLRPFGLKAQDVEDLNRHLASRS